MSSLWRRFKAKPEIEEISRFWYRFKRSPLSMLSLCAVIALVFIAIFAYQLAPYPEDERKTRVERKNLPPSLEHPFGTDDLGMDVLSRILIGTRISLPVGLASLTISTVIGISLGLISGFFGGFPDWIIMRLIEIFLAIPPLVLALVITVLLKPSLEGAMLAISISWWPGFARLVRTETMRVRQKEFVEAAHSVGASKLYLAFREIPPNIIVPIIIRYTLNIGYAILTLATLGFLGLGARPPAPEWGSMAGTTRYLLPDVWWPTLFPSLFIFITVAAFNFLGDGIQDAITEAEIE